MRVDFVMLIYFAFTTVFDSLGSQEQQQRDGNIHIPKSQALCICPLLTLPIMRLKKEKKTKQLLQNDATLMKPGFLQPCTLWSTARSAQVFPHCQNVFSIIFTGT